MFRDVPKAFILFGPSGSGKTYIKKYLTKKGIKPLKLYTTRPRRSEESTNDYYFISLKEFRKKEKNDEFALVIKINHNWMYGLTKKEIKKNRENDIVIDFINQKYALNFYDLILKTHKPFLCFFEIPLYQRLKILEERNLTKKEIQNRLKREERYKDLDIVVKNRSFLFADFQSNIEKIDKLLEL